METPSMERLKSVIEPVDKFHWKSEGLTVIGDGYLEDGTRVHLVDEKLKVQPVMICNAWVISANNLRGK